MTATGEGPCVYRLGQEGARRCTEASCEHNTSATVTNPLFYGLDLARY